MRLNGTLGMLALGAVAAVAALAGWQQSRQGDATVAQPAARAVPPATRAGDARLPLADRLGREWLSREAIGDPFGAREAPRPGAREAPKPFVATAPAPAPMAAPFPYRYAGQFSLADGKRHVYLMKGNDLFLINVGDVLDGGFKVTAIAEDALEVLHVPSSIATLMQFSSFAGLAADGPSPGAPDQSSAPPVATMSTSPATAQPAAGSRPGAGPGYPVGNIAGAGGIRTVPAAGPASVTAGSVPQGQMGFPGPAAGAAPLGAAPAGSGSMPVLPAPVGVMRSLPPPTGRLGT